uniref:Uncharacterized protein n=1 Tax=Nelumbo nucifera TaxID=4432 RepID=A0A822XNR7_NELNU|nr:TPA_asm: hypothetical protein HUJ06_020621 [Nelumbo nucifera]
MLVKKGDWLRALVGKLFNILFISLSLS